MFSWLPNRLAMSGSLMAIPLRSPSTDCWLPMVVMFALWICAKRRPKVEALSVYLLVTVDALGKRRNSLCNIPGWIICYPFQSPAKEKNIVIIFRVAIMFGFATVFTRNRSLLVPLSVFVCALLASPKKRSDSVLIFTWKKPSQHVYETSISLNIYRSSISSLFDGIKHFLDVWLTAFGSNLRFLTTCEYQVDPLRLATTALKASHNPRRIRYINAESHDASAVF